MEKKEHGWGHRETRLAIESCSSWVLSTWAPLYYQLLYTLEIFYNKRCVFLNLEWFSKTSMCFRRANAILNLGVTESLATFLWFLLQHIPYDSDLPSYRLFLEWILSKGSFLLLEQRLLIPSHSVQVSLTLESLPDSPWHSYLRQLTSAALCTNLFKLLMIVIIIFKILICLTKW